MNAKRLREEGAPLDALIVVAASPASSCYLTCEVRKSWAIVEARKTLVALGICSAIPAFARIHHAIWPDVVRPPTHPDVVDITRSLVKPDKGGNADAIWLSMIA